MFIECGHVSIVGSLPSPSGMADYQVLPPGLSQVTYKADTVDPNSFQINGSLYREDSITMCCLKFQCNVRRLVYILLLSICIFDVYILYRSSQLTLYVHVHVYTAEPFDDTFESSKVPLFLPPRTFSKFDKPSNYA